MKRLLITLLLMSLCTALADTHIPNTQVSYKVNQNELGENSSMVFVDATNDGTGKTYASFVCEGTLTRFRIYSKDKLGRYSGEFIPITLRADKGNTKTGKLTLRQDNQTGRLSVLGGNIMIGAQATSIFLAAQNQVAIRVERPNASPVTYIFPIKGFTQAYRAIKACE